MALQHGPQATTVPCVNPLGAQPERGEGSPKEIVGGPETGLPGLPGVMAINCLGARVVYQSQQNYLNTLTTNPALPV